MPFTNAFVTGGGGGLGRGFALELARRGCNVFVTDVDADAAAETARLVRELGPKAGSARCDVRDPAAFEAAAAEADASVGPIDLCVNNAGVMVGGDIGSMTLERWHLAIDINLWGAIHGAHVFTPRFKARGGGAFINVASISGVLATPETAPYNISKAGILSLSETMFAELDRFGIRTTVLCPSAVRTGIFDAMQTTNPVHVKLARKNATQGGPREPAEVASITLDAAERGELYVFPQTDAKLAWWAKRYFPGWFARFSRTARNREWFEKAV